MTEPSDEDTARQQRVTASEFWGVSADSDDLLADGELREGMINPNASGGKGKNSGPGMMPPMMMGGAGAGAGVGAGAQNAMGANAMAAGQMNAMGAQSAMRSAGGAPGMGAGIGPGGGNSGVLAAGDESLLGGIPSNWRPGDPILPGDPRHPGGDLGAIFPGDPRYGDLVPGWSDGVYGDPSDPSTWNIPTGYNPNDPSTWGRGDYGLGGVLPSDGAKHAWSYGDPIMPGDPRHPGGPHPLYPGDSGYDRSAFDGVLGPDGWSGINRPHETNIPTAPGPKPGDARDVVGDGRGPHDGVHAPQPPLGGPNSGYGNPSVGPTDGVSVPGVGQPNLPTAGPTSGPWSGDVSANDTGTDTSFSVDHAQLREQAKKWQDASDKTAALHGRMRLPQDFGIAAPALRAMNKLGGCVIDWSTGASKEFNQIADNLIAAADRYEEQEGFGVRQSNQVGGQ
ncbi:hypothetical protein [uncultured Tessaracoccus sp.]|uniref:hypothetical protein n=1 Tax=uncultured Tessaracoccus sp. TaxID=905023 RepID=UPI002604F519|nr:hypothetical protein [uncultured Tessaracoccus sp.]